MTRELLHSGVASSRFSTLGGSPDATPTVQVYADTTLLGSATVTADGTDSYRISYTLPSSGIADYTLIWGKVTYDVSGEAQPPQWLLLGQLVPSRTPRAAAISEQIADDIVSDANGWDSAIPYWRDVYGFAEESTSEAIKAKTDQLTFTVAGQVDANAQSGSAAFTVLPVSGAMVSRSRGTTIEVFTLETSTVSVAVTDSSGTAVDLEALTLEVVIEDMRTGDKSVIADGSLTKVTNTLSFAVPSAVSLTEGNFEWSLRNTANDAVLVHGPFIVTYAPQSDP